jgi:hypothetical protein
MDNVAHPKRIDKIALDKTNKKDVLIYTKRLLTEY